MNQPGNIVGRVDVMSVDTHDDIASGRRNAHVQGRGRDAIRIVQQANEGVAAGELFHDRSGTVVAHAVDDKHFQLILRIIVFGDRLQTLEDPRRFVAAGNDHGNRPRRVRRHALAF